MDTSASLNSSKIDELFANPYYLYTWFKTYDQAIKFPCWKEATNTKIKALKDNQIWNLVDL